MKQPLLAYLVRLTLCLVAIVPISVSAQWQQVDYRYAPQWHASSISFPDDTCKTLVGPLGQLLYDFGGKDFFPYANDRGFQTVIHLLADEGTKINNQRLQSARVPIVVTEGSFAGTHITQEAIAVGLDYTRKGISTKKGNREDLVLTTISNSGAKSVVFHPVVVINSTLRVVVEGNRITFTDSVGNQSRLFLSEKASKVRQNLSDSTRKTLIELPALTVKPKETKRLLAIYDNGKPSVLATEMAVDPSKLLVRIDAIKTEQTNYWNNKTDIPYGYVSVPDKEIQNLVDASLRGIWQARELKHDSIAFQVGPTCYRGLWIVDGAFLLETATIMGRGQDARQGIEYMLSFQQANGGVRKMSDDYWKENGIVLWTCVRHAMLTQDKQWLQSIWPKLSKIVTYIKTLREETLKNNIPLDDGLMPPGEIDGGLWGKADKAEYSNTYWNLMGLKAVIQAAGWIGDQTAASSWQKEYEDFYSRFQAAAKRDLATDVFGNKYIPIVMDPKMRSLPQRAQWTFCQAVYPGQLFEESDPLLKGTMKMLDATLQEGMVMGTGWQVDGIWNYFASFYGHASLWLGEKQKAIESLYAFANHASPLYAWREEHNPRDLQAKYVGDMPHNWASAEFLRLVVHLLALDRGQELHLFEGMPEEWLQPGMNTYFKDVNTVFGKLSFNLKVDITGKKASLTVDKLSGTGCTAIFVHLGKSGNEQPVKLDPTKPNTITLALK